MPDLIQRSMRSSILMMLLVVLHPASLAAQSNATDGALDGFVRDSDAGSIATAKVIAVNLGTGQVREAATDRSGYYRFPLLQVGDYEVLVSAPGFADYRQSGIRLNVGQQTRVDVTLGVGGTTETVTVTADASMVLSSQAVAGEVLPELAIRTLPITSRNVYNFHLIGPGVKGRPSTGFGTTQFVVGAADRMQWYMDGIDNTSRNGSRQIRLVITTPENVEQMQLMTGAYSAEFGRAAGGVVNVITRSGSNQVRGSAMAMIRPSGWIATPPLASTRPKQTWHMVQGNAGGPIVRDRVFWFANYEFNPYENVNPVTITLAAVAALGLPASELDDTNGEIFHTPSVKVNFRLNNANSGFIRYNRFTNRQPGGGSGLNTLSRGTIYKDRMNGIGGQIATVIRPTLLNEVRVGFNVRNTWNTRPCTGSDDGAQINISGVANFGCNPASASTSHEASLEFIDNVTATRGAHTFKAGLNYQTTVNEPTSGLGRVFTFSGLAASGPRGAVSSRDQYLLTRQGAIDPATGRPFTYTQLAQDLGNPSVSLSFQFLNVFVQDEWRVGPELTLSAGLRYELMFFPTLDPDAPYERSRTINTDGNNLAPRVGVTWTPGSEKTVVRGGYGIYYDSPGLNLATNAAQRSTRLLSYQVQGTDPRAPVFPNLLAAADPSFSIVPSIVAFDEDFQIMYAHNAGLQVSRELTRDLSLSVGYSYWGHRNGPYTHDVNLPAPVGQLEDGRPIYSGAAGRPDTRFRAINLVESGARSNYHALDLSVRRRFRGGLQFSLNYGYSRSRGTGDLTGGTLMDPGDIERDWGPNNLDQPHTVSAQWSFEPEIESSGLRWLNGLRFSGTTFYGSGFPFSPGAGADLNNDLVLNDRLPGTGRNSARLPDFFQTDLRVSRRFGLGGGRALEVMIESENAFNRTNATGVITQQRAADFGRVTATRPGRYVQLGARFAF